MISSIAPAGPATSTLLKGKPQTALVVEANGHTFSYTEVRKDTGEVTWRWPIEPVGQIVNLSA